ncbi:MAG: biotin/lipoyl-binding protein, partial [Candidatus Omnitrophica bacterium]|nr:biotin/lipoyl-binding protein [Candidatus Omnitrophota bacterium]
TLAGNMVIIPEGLSNKGEVVTVYDARGRAILIVRTGSHKQDEVTVFDWEETETDGNVKGELRQADPIGLSNVSHNVGDFQEKEQAEKPDEREDDTPAVPPLKEKSTPDDAGKTGPEEAQDDKRSSDKRFKPDEKRDQRGLMTYEEAHGVYENLTDWRGKVSSEEGSVERLKLAMRSVLGLIAEGEIKIHWHGFGRQRLAWQIYRCLEFTLGKKAMGRDPGLVLLNKALKHKKKPEALREILGEYDSLGYDASEDFTGNRKKSIADILEVVLRDSYYIKQAEHRLEEATVTRELAGSGRLFWDVGLSYGISDGLTGSPGNRLLRRAETDARETAVRLSEARRELEEDRAALENDQRQLYEAYLELEDDQAALRNDQQQLAEARLELEDDLVALENDLEQLQEAIEDEDEERIEQELAEIAENEREIEEDRARIEQELAEIEEGELEIRNDYARIERELAEITDDEEEIQNGLARIRALEEEEAANRERIRELNKPELRLTSTLGMVLYDAGRSQDVESTEATERQRRINVELAKLELMHRVVGIYAGIMTAKRKTSVIAKHLASLKEIREKGASFNMSSEELLVLDMHIAKAENEMSSQQKVVLDGKSELRYIMGLPSGIRFELDEADYSPERIAQLLSRSNIRMDRYLALILAKKSEEIESLQALVPSNVFEHLNLSVAAVWEEDLLRRVLYDNLRDPSFLGVRAGMVFGDMKRQKAARRALLLYLKAIDEYKLIVRMQYTMAARAKDTIQTLTAAQKERLDIAGKAREHVNGIRTRYDSGIGGLLSLLRAMEEAKNAEVEKELSYNLLLRAEVVRAKSRGTTKMDLDQYDLEQLEKIADLIEEYWDEWEEERFAEAEVVWLKVREYLPGLVMPMSERQTDEYIGKVDKAIERLEDMTEENRKTTDELEVYIRDNLSVEERRKLARHIKEFEKGLWTLGNFLRGRVKSDEEMAELIDGISTILPGLDIPRGVDHDEREDIVRGKLPVITSSLDMAPYSLKGTSIVDMFLVACERGRLGPAQKDVELARNMARDDVKVFRPIVNIGASIGLSGDIFDPGNLNSTNFINGSGLGISIAIPLNNPGKREKREAGKEFVLSSLIKLKLAERELQVNIARQLVRMHSLMERYSNLDEKTKNLQARINALRSNPRVSGIQIERLQREKRKVLLEQKHVLLQFKIARNNLRDILGLEYSDIMMIDNITNKDIEKILDTLKESLEGNFVVSSTVEMVKEGSMVTIGPDNELAANNIPTGLTVAGRRKIRILAVRDEKNDYMGQIALDRGKVLSSDIKSIPEGSRVTIAPDNKMIVTDPDGEKVDTSKICAGDISLRYIVSVTDSEGESAGEVLIDYRTGDEALRLGIHRAERRGYALSSVAIIKEGDQFSLVISVSPFAASGCPLAIYPRFPDSWLDWKFLGWFNLPGFLTGAHARQKTRKILSGLAVEESKRQDLLLRKAEQIAQRQKESAIELYRLADKKVRLARNGLEICDEQIKRLEANMDGLADLGRLERLKAERIRLLGIIDQAENNLAVMRILLSVLDVKESEIKEAPDLGEVVSLDRAISNIGQRTEDAIARLDISIARQMQKLSSFASMFEQEMTAGVHFYEGGDGTSGITVSLTIKPDMHGAEMAKLDVEDKKIITGLKMENARKRIIELYGAYARAAMRVAEQEAKIRKLNLLTGAHSGMDDPQADRSMDRRAAELELTRVRLAKADTKEALTLGMSELQILLESKTGVAVDLSYLMERMDTYRDSSSLDADFRRGLELDRDKALQHMRNRGKKAELAEDRALWSVLPTLTAQGGWYDMGSGPSYMLSVATRILGSGRSIRAKLARLEQKRYKAAELNRIRQIRYEWDLISNELDIAMKESKKLDEALGDIEKRINYVLNRKIADHALGGRTTAREIRRLVEEYESLKYRYFEANIRLNISYARAVNMLNNLMGIEATTELLGELADAPDRSSAGEDLLNKNVKAGAKRPDGDETVTSPAGPVSKGAERKKDVTSEDEKAVPPVKEKAPPSDKEVPLEEEKIPPEKEMNPSGKKKVPEPRKALAGEISSRGNMSLAGMVPAMNIAGVDLSGMLDSIDLFYDSLKGDITIMLDDFRGSNKAQESGDAVVCEIEPVIGNGRYTIQRIRQEGEMVKKGDWLVQFDPSFLEKERDAQEKLINQTERAVAESQELLREALQQKKALTEQYAEDKRATTVKVTAAGEMLKQAEERIKTAELNLNLAEGFVQAIRVLWEKKIASEFEYNRALEFKNEAVRVRQEAYAERTRARKILEEAETEIHLVEAVFSRQMAVLDGIVERSKKDIEAAKEKLRLQEEKLKTLKKNIDRCTIYAQRDGMVLYSNVTGVYFFTIPLKPENETVIGPGLSVPHGREIMRIVDPGSMLFRPRSALDKRSTITSEVRTGVGSRQGSIGIPIKTIVPAGAYVEKGDIIVQFDDSVLLDFKRLEEEKLQETRRLISELSSLLGVATRARAVYLKKEYPARVCNAEARLKEARLVHEQRKKDVLVSSRRTAALKKRLEMAEKLAASNTVPKSEVDAFRSAYNSSRIEEYTARAAMESARYTEAAAEADLERVKSERDRIIAVYDREIRTAREKLRSARADEAIDLKRIGFYDDQIEKCTIRATRSGKVTYINNMLITLRGSNLKPVERELVVGQGTIMPPGVPFIKITDIEQEQASPAASKEIGSFIDKKAAQEEVPGKRSEPVLCKIKPLRLYNIVGYGATLTYIVPDGEFVRKGDKLAEFDSSVYERERDLQKKLITETELAYISAKESLTESEKQKKAFIERYDEDRKFLVEKLKTGERMLADSQQKLKRAEDNIVLARRNIERLDILAERSIVSLVERLEAFLVLNDAQRAKGRAEMEIAAARRILEGTRAELEVLEAVKVRETDRFNGMIERAKSDMLASQEKLKLQKRRFKGIEENIDKCVIYAQHSGKVNHSNQLSANLFGFPIRPVPRNVTMGPRITVGYAQKILSIDTSVTLPGEAQSGSEDEGVTLIGANVSTAYDSGSGVVYPAIKKIHVEDGEYVEKGQVIAELESSALEMLKREAEIRLRESNRLIAEAGSLLDEAKRRHKAYTSMEYPALLLEAQERFNRCKKDYEARKSSRVSSERIVALRKVLLDMARRVLASNTIAMSAVEELHAAYNSAIMEEKTASYEESQALLRMKQAESEIERLRYEHKMRLAALTREMNTARERLRLAREKAAIDQGRVDFYRKQIENCVVRATVSGTVSFMHSLPVFFIGIPLKRVPRERIVAEGSIVGPEPFIKITHAARSDARKTDKEIYEPVSTSKVPEGAVAITSGVEAVSFGRRGEHGAMILEIAPEGRVKKGQLLVRFDISAQERLMPQLRKLINEQRMISSDSSRNIDGYQSQRKILEAKLEILRKIQEEVSRGGEDMASYAREVRALAEKNITLADKRIQRVEELLEKMIVAKREHLEVQIQAEEERIIRDRALRELAVAILMQEQGENVFNILRAQMNDELAILDGLIERARIDRKAAQADIRTYSKKIEQIRRNKENSVIYAPEDGWVRYTHDVGKSFLGIPITYIDNPVYIGTGCVVKNGQTIMHLFEEKPQIEASEKRESSSRGVQVISTVRSGESDRNGPRGARILKIPKKDGDHVRKGEVILVLDDSELQSAKKQAEIELGEHRRAAAEYAALRAEAERELTEYLSNEYPALVEQVNSRIREARTLGKILEVMVDTASDTARIKKAEYEALKKLKAKGVCSQQELELAEADWNRASLSVRRLSYRLRWTAMTLKEAEQALKALEYDKMRRESELKARIQINTEKAEIARENAEICEKTIAFYKGQIADCLIKAPRSGIIKYNNQVSYTFFINRWTPREIIITVGYEVAPGMTVATISDPTTASSEKPSGFSLSPIGIIAFILLMTNIARAIYKQIRSGLNVKYHEDPRHIGPPDPGDEKESTLVEEESSEQTFGEEARRAEKEKIETEKESLKEPKVKMSAEEAMKILAGEIKIINRAIGKMKRIQSALEWRETEITKALEEIRSDRGAGREEEFRHLYESMAEELHENLGPRNNDEVAIELEDSRDRILSALSVLVEGDARAARARKRLDLAREQNISLRERIERLLASIQSIKPRDDEDIGGPVESDRRKPGTDEPEQGDIPSDGKDKNEDPNNRRSGGKGPILGAILLFFLVPLNGCVKSVASAGKSADSVWGSPLFGEGFSWYSSLSQTYPAFNVLSFVASAALIMIIINSLLVMGRDSRKESVSRIETFTARPGLFISFALSIAILTAFTGIPSLASWSQAVEIVKIITVGAVFVTYPFSIAGTYLIGFFRKAVNFRVRLPIPTGVVKLRYNSVPMSLSEGTKRLFKWWAVLSSVAAFLVYVMPSYIPVPSTQGPSITLRYIAGWIMHHYNEVSVIHPYVSIIKWGIVVLVAAALAEMVTKNLLKYLQDDSRVLRRVASKLIILGLTAGFLYIASPYLPALLAFPGGVTMMQMLQVTEVAVLITIGFAFYFLIGAYIMGMFSSRVNRIFQVPPLFNILIARFRSNAPRLIALRRVAVFIVSLFGIECLLASILPSPFLVQFRDMYNDFSSRNPGIIVGAWLGMTVLLTAFLEWGSNILSRIFPSMRKGSIEKVTKLLSFTGAALAVSFFVVGFPPLSAWSQVVSWLGIFMLVATVIAMPIQIIGAFFLGIRARVLYLRVLTPFMAHVKQRIREKEMHQSDAVFRLLNIWKWLIVGCAALFYGGPLVFTPEALGGRAHNPILATIYSKAVKWTVFLSDQYPFFNIIFWTGVVLLLAAILEVAIAKTVRTRTGDEYMINRLTAKVSAVAIVLLAVVYLGPIPMHLKAAGMAISLMGMMGTGIIQFIMSLSAAEHNGMAGKILRWISVSFLAIGLIFLLPAFPGVVSWASFWPAAETAALILAGFSVYLMLGGFVMGIFTPRINRVIQPLFTFFLVTRLRSEDSPMTVVKNMFKFTVIMAALAYLFSMAYSFPAQAVNLSILLSAGLLLLASSTGFNLWKKREAFHRAKISPHRREEKFELENINNEPRMARDMMEAMGMIGDIYNPTKTYYYNHSLYLDTPGYRWKGLGYFIRHPLSEVRQMLTLQPQLLTYFARENNYRSYRFKARIRWYGDRELIAKIFSVKISEEMTAEGFIESMRRSIAPGDDLGRRFETVVSNLPEESAGYTAKQMKSKLLDLAGQTKVDKGKIHLEIKNRLDTRMWKFETGVWEWAVPYIFALADGGTVRMNGHVYVFRESRQTEDFFGMGRKKSLPVVFRVDKETSEKIVAEKIKRTSDGYRVFIDGKWCSFKDSDIDRQKIDYSWLPETYQGKKCRGDRASEAGLREFCTYIKQYRLVPTVQVSYERLEFVSADGDRDELLKRLIPLALEYRERMKNSPDAAYWRSIYRSPAGKYLRVILDSEDPEHADIQIAPEDLDYLRMTLDMNVRWRVCDDLHDPTLFTGLEEFRRTWPDRTILEVKYRGKRATPWVYDMVKELDKRRENEPVNDHPIRRQPAGKYCDSVSVWLYWKFLEKAFKTRSVGQAILRFLGLEKGYPESPNSPKWAGFTRHRFGEIFDIDKKKPYDPVHGIDPLGYGLSVEAKKRNGLRSRDDEDDSDEDIPPVGPEDEPEPSLPGESESTVDEEDSAAGSEEQEEVPSDQIEIKPEREMPEEMSEETPPENPAEAAEQAEVSVRTEEKPDEQKGVPSSIDEDKIYGGEQKIQQEEPPQEITREEAQKALSEAARTINRAIGKMKGIKSAVDWRKQQVRKALEDFRGRSEKAGEEDLRYLRDNLDTDVREKLAPRNNMEVADELDRSQGMIMRAVSLLREDDPGVVKAVKRLHMAREQNKSMRTLIEELLRLIEGFPAREEVPSRSSGTEVGGTRPQAEPKSRAQTEIRYRLLEASGDKAFANAFADAIFSFYREKRKIVFAFDSYLGGGQGTKAIKLLEMVDDLKADNRYAEFLENIEVMRFDTSRGEKGLRALREKINSGALVFSFARDTAEARDNMKNMINDPDHKLSFINEEMVSRILSTEKVYYPLFEIVTITLARYIDEMSIDDIQDIGEKIAVRAQVEGGALIFTILTSIKRFETNRELLQHYAMKKKVLLAA